jgi:radical SAM superfamily enzyme
MRARSEKSHTRPGQRVPADVGLSAPHSKGTTSLYHCLVCTQPHTREIITAGQIVLTVTVHDKNKSWLNAALS